jgi:hypothetical protein
MLLLHCLGPLVSLPAGPCDLGITYGYHVKNDYDIGAMIASKDLAHVYDDVLKVREKLLLTLLAPSWQCISTDSRL